MMSSGSVFGVGPVFGVVFGVGPGIQENCEAPSEFRDRPRDRPRDDPATALVITSSVFFASSLCLCAGRNPFRVVMNRGAISQGSSSDSQPWAELRNPFGILEHRSRRTHLCTVMGDRRRFGEVGAKKCLAKTVAFG